MKRFWRGGGGDGAALREDIEHEGEERELDGERGVDVGERRGDEEEVTGSTGSTGPLCSLSVRTGQEVIRKSEECPLPNLEVALETDLGSTAQRVETGQEVNEGILPGSDVILHT